MAHTLLSEIHDKSNQWTICVVVSRMWHYRGGTDDGPIRHTDLVLLDKEGNHMYGQIPPEPAERFKNLLREGKVYVIRKFFCNQSKPAWRPVESQYMVQFTRYTVLQEMPGLEEEYPFCTYSLTPFMDLPKPSLTPARFINVIGKITMVSDIVPIQSMHQTVASDTRTVVLQDLLGNEVKITLWGERAIEFNADAVRAMCEKEPVIGGTLPKMTHGTKSLSGSSACRWYIDEDIPDINAFRAKLGDDFVPLAAYAPSGQNAFTPRVQQAPVDATVLELTNLDPFEDMNKRFLCVVTVDRITPDKRWFFASCADCRKSARYISSQYQCSGLKCSSVDADQTYYVSVMATNGTAEVEFVLFDKVAAGALGKSISTLLQQRYPGHATTEEAAHAARLDTAIPLEISRLVGQKYKLMVSISKKSLFTNMDSLSFQISRIEKTFRPELPASVFGATSLPAGSSSSSQMPSGSIQNRKTFPTGSRSPAPQPHTPPPFAAKSADFTPEKSDSSLGIKRGTRRSLFSTSHSNKNELPHDSVDASKEVPNTDDVPSMPAVTGTLPASVVASVHALREKDEVLVPLKKQRVADGGSKAANTIKKPK
ncbi:unnamed protein product [Alopecurus aequalis]